ncbi:MAG: hypothetical protein IPP72_04435 [Chitinophagaceae bacterium]|nr:hypothetical protein [Chitinophagaceae bacterium]
MQEAELSPQESLILIDSMINKARNRFSENGFMYLLWGWLIFVCSVGQFILIELNWFSHPEIIWASTWLAVIYQAIYFSLRKKKTNVKTYSDEIISSIWISFGVCMFILVFILSRYNAWSIMYPLILMIYGIPTFLSGTVMQFKPLKKGGIICWALALVATFVSPLYMLLLLAMAVVAAWIIPGYLLRKKFNDENK